MFNKKKIVFLFFFLLFAFGFYKLAFASGSITSINLDPVLDITRFAPYRIISEITGNPTSVNVEITGINSDGVESWNYKTDGTPESDSRTKTMSYDSASSRWRSQAVYPDDVYPEIYYAGSNTTWYNAPSNMNIWRRNYQVMHFNNSFTVDPNMTFFIEVNAAPVNTTNSSDLFVYVVGRDVDLYSYFNSDWRSKSQTQLVGTINRNQAFHHQHTSNATHHLVALSTNADGTLGSNNIDISSDFFIVLYQDSNNTNRGWNLRYHSSSICQNDERWFVADRSGGGTWNTPVYQNGCPDVHTHIARNTVDYNDGVRAVVTANYADGSVSSTEEFYFGTIPNLAPNSTSFVAPVVGGVYDGGSSSTVSISWNEATDPNNDSLVYSIYLLDGSNNQIGTIVSSTTATSTVWDISGLSNGTYSLKGVISEVGVDTPLSTEFSLGGNFTIQKTEPIYTLSSIALSTDSLETPFLKAGKKVTLNFTASGVLSGANVDFYSGGTKIDDSRVVLDNVSGNSWTVEYTATSSDGNGNISFDISATNLDQIYYNTTDNSYLNFDSIAPTSITATVPSGSYSSMQTLILSSSDTNFDNIYYTDDGTNPVCGGGTTFSDNIGILEPQTIKAIACDVANNSSAILTLNYTFAYEIRFLSNTENYSVLSTTSVVHGDTVTLPATPERFGYDFADWYLFDSREESFSLFDPATVVTENLDIYAGWNTKTYYLTYKINNEDGIYPTSSFSGEVHASETNQFGDTITVKDQSTASLSGYTFNGWNTQYDGIDYSYNTGDSIVLDQATLSRSNFLINDNEIVLYAQWLENDKCSIVFDANGGSNIPYGSYTVNCGESLADNGVSVFSDPVYWSKEGYDFVKWNTSADGSGTDFDDDTLITASSTIIYAVWTPSEYQINFDAQGGTVTSSTKNVFFNTTVGILPTATKNNYSFTSWNTLADGSGTNYTATTTYTLSTSTTLYAQYTGATRSLIFDNQGGSSATSSKDVVYNTEVGTLPTPTKSGYTFSSWNTEIDGSGDTYSSSTTFLSEENVVLYAKYLADNYLLSFHSLGGSLAQAKEVTYGSEVGTLPTPTKSGYVFAGWYTEAYGEGTLYSSNTVYNTAGPLLLVANWTVQVNEYVLSYSSGVGGTISGSSSQTVSQGSNGSPVTAVANTGYRFVRWSDSSTSNPRRDLSVNSNISVSAVFEIIPNNSTLSLPGAIGLGARDVSSISGNNIGGVVSVGEINNLGVNVLTYITNHNYFLAPQSSDNWQLANHRFVITNLDLYNNIVTLVFCSEPQSVVLPERGSKNIDLDKDGIYDVEVTFTDVYINRAEITIKSLEGKNVLVNNETNYEVIKIKNDKMYNKLKGKIILKVEDNGRAYYVSPTKKEMYYLGRPADAFQVMRSQGLGIKNSDLNKILISGDKIRENISLSFSKKQIGKIFLQVENKGEAWYVDLDGNRHFLGRPNDAFRIMRSLSLGISNVDFAKLIK